MEQAGKQAWAGEAALVRRIRWFVGPTLVAGTAVVATPWSATVVLALVVVVAVVLHVGLPGRWEHQAQRAMKLFGLLLVVSTALHGPLVWWFPALVLLLVGPLPAAIGIYVSTYNVDGQEVDRSAEMWTWYLWLRPWIRRTSVLGVWLIGGWIFGDIGGIAVGLPAMATAAGRPLFGFGGLAVAFLFTGASPPWLISVGMTVLVALSHIPPRPPRRSLDLPPAKDRLRHPLVCLRLWRLDSVLNRSEWERAVEMAAPLLRHHLLADHAHLRAAAALLELEQPQAAMDHLEPVVGDPCPVVQASALLMYGRALALSDRSEDALRRLSEAARLSGVDMHRARVALVEAEVLIARGDKAAAIERAEFVVGVFRGGRHLVERMQATRIITEARWRSGDLDGARRAVMASYDIGITVRWLRQYLRPEGDPRDETSLVFSRGAALLIDQLRMRVIEALLLKLDPRSQDPHKPTDEMESEVMDVLAELDECSEMFGLLNRPLDRSGVDLARASVLSRRSPTRELNLVLRMHGDLDKDERSRLTQSWQAQWAEHALNLVVSVLADLDKVRHSLRTQAARAIWADRFHTALQQALDLAHRNGSAQKVAELIELARVQAIPVLGGGSHPEDDVVLATAPTVRVRRKAGVIRSGTSVTEPVDIEAAAAAAVGHGAWWLSYWEADSRLYWSLVPPDGQLHHGVIEAGPGSEMEITLAALVDALPVRLEGEDDVDMDFRLNRSPLLTSPSGETKLAHRLGTLLLPPALRHELMKRHDHGADPLRLAISPASQLSQVPWSLLTVDEPDGPRLIEVAICALAPSATLLTSTNSRPHPAGPFPLGLAVLDPVAEPAAPPLPAARAIASVLPPQVTVLGGRHWDAQPATPSEVTDALSRCGRQSTVLFGCHAIPGVNAKPSSSALVLAGEEAENKAAHLTAIGLLTSRIDPAVFPAQVSLQACDTSDLASSLGGEWLSLAPALLAAGASTVLTTLFPLVDSESRPGEESLLRSHLSGEDLADAVRAEQLRGLATWRTSGEGPPASLADAPIVWSAYAVCSTGRAYGQAASPEPLVVSDRFIEVVCEGVEGAETLRDRTVTSAQLMAGYVSRETEVLETSLARLILGLVAVIGLPKILRARSSSPVGGRRPSDELVALTTQAAAKASAAGGVLEPEHLIDVSLAQRRGPAYRFLQLTRLTRLRAFRQQAAANLRQAELRPRVTGTRDRVAQSPDRRAFVTHLLTTIPHPTTSSLDPNPEPNL